MIITYHGHSCFKMKGKHGSIVADPYNKSVGFSLPKLSADIVTVSHDHGDHSNYGAIGGTSRREKPFIVDQPGEYEVGGNSVFGVPAFHDGQKGSSRGNNIIFSYIVDGIRICHVGDLGHELDSTTIKQIGMIDVLFICVGGVYTIGPKEAINVAHSLEPNIVIPMHYRTEAHDKQTFDQVKSLNDFLQVFGSDVKPIDKLVLNAGRLPDEMELIVLEQV